MRIHYLGCSFDNVSVLRFQHCLKKFQLDRQLGIHCPLGNSSQEDTGIYLVQLHIVLKIFNSDSCNTGTTLISINHYLEFELNSKFSNNKPGGQKKPAEHNPDGDDSFSS